MTPVLRNGIVGMDDLLGSIRQKGQKNLFNVAARVCGVALHLADRLRLAILISGLRRIRLRSAIVASAGKDADQARILLERLAGELRDSGLRRPTSTGRPRSSRRHQSIGPGDTTDVDRFLRAGPLKTVGRSGSSAAASQKRSCR